MREETDKNIFILISIIVLLISPIFYYKRIGILDFWFWFSLTIIIILFLIFIHEKRFLKNFINDLTYSTTFKIMIGLLSSLILYFIFYSGKIIITFLFKQSGSMISGVYKLGSNYNPIKIGILLFFIIGPGEEIIWRGFIQNKLTRFSQSWKGLFITTVLYTTVHIGSLNPVLLLAAFTGGIFWGILYIMFKSLLINIVSHTIWDISVFLLFPF